MIGIPEILLVAVPLLTVAALFAAFTVVRQAVRRGIEEANSIDSR